MRTPSASSTLATGPEGQRISTPARLSRPSSFDAGQVDEVDVRQVEAQLARRSKDREGLAQQQADPLRDDAAFEPEQRLGSRTHFARDP